MLVATASILGGCAGTPSSDPGVAAVNTQQEPVEVAAEPTSEEVKYRVFAGEYLGAEVDLQGGVSEYLEAAMESDDE